MKKRKERTYRSPFQDILKAAAIALWVRIVILAVTTPIPGMIIFWTIVGLLQLIFYGVIDDWFMKIGFYGEPHPRA